jgi:hypothetical protein
VSRNSDRHPDHDGGNLEPDALPELDELLQDAPVLNPNAIWQRVSAGMDTDERLPRATNPNPIAGWLGRSSQRVAATAAGLIIAVGLAVGLLVATSSSADASFLERVSALGHQTDVALEDGILSESEALDLGNALDELIARIESGDDLAELTTEELEIVLGALDSIRGDLVVAAGGELVAVGP